MKIVIVGCTHAGTAAVVNLKELHPESEITIYEKNDNLSFLSCGIALNVGGVIKETKNQYKKSMAERLNSGIEDKDELKSLISSFEMIIKALSHDSQLIIVNEYVEQKENEWWVDYYSRATYYRLKTRALEEFLFYVNVY